MRGGIITMALLAAASVLNAWTPGSSEPLASSGFLVDTSKRNDVVSFWHGAYMPSESYWERIGWSGDYGSIAAGAEGTTSPEFVDDVERRVNFVRALCGVPAVISMNTDEAVLIESGDAYVPAASTLKSGAVQRSALMVALGSTNLAVSHNPPSNLAGWTTAAWNAHNKSTISKGFFGPGAVDAYFREDAAGSSNWNFDAGHRRWLLAVPLTDMATGDTPGDYNSSTGSITQPSNLIYVKPKASELSSAAPRFVSYPASGYFPVGLNSPFWSLSHGRADFSSATVSMRDESGTPLPTTVVSRRSGFAENALVWRVPDEVGARSAPVDRTYHVTVSGIRGEVAESYSWSVCLIDPDRLNDPLDLVGPDSPVASRGAGYQLTSVEGCDRMETGFFLVETAAWVGTAEDDDEVRVIDRTDSTYDLLAHVTNTQPGFASNYYTEGSNAYRLTFPRAYDPRLNSIADEVFELEDQIIPGPSASVTFQFRRGYMSPTTVLACESSMDGGLSWQLVGAPIAGNGNGQADSGFSSVALPLAESGGPVQIRFRLFRTSSTAGFYNHERYPNYATGAFIDELRMVDCEWLKPGGLVETTPAEDEVGFGTATASLEIRSGQKWSLRTRPVMGGHAFAWGPMKVVYPLGPLGLSGAQEPPVSGAFYSFIPDPSADSHVFEVARFASGSWSEGAEMGSGSTVIDGSSSVYDLISTRAGYRQAGSSSFRLAVQSSDGEDYLEIDREVLATGLSRLEFWLRRGWSPNQLLDVEISTDSGVSWTSVGSIEGKNFGDSVGSSHALDLSGFVGELISCRLVLRSTGPVNFNASNSGMWLDEIAMTDVEDLLTVAATPVGRGVETVLLDGTTVGEELVEGKPYRLRMIPVTGGFEGEPGAPLFVTPSAVALNGYAAWVAQQHPSVVGGFDDADEASGIANGIKYAFGMNPSERRVEAGSILMDPDKLVLERELDELREGVIYEAEISTDLRSWSTTGVTVTHENGFIRAVATRPEGAAFIRWKITEG